MRSAFLPDVTAALAQVLTGEPRAEKILAELHADNFFIERKAGAGPASYEFHPLFRDFLRASAAQTLGAAAVDDIRRKAAALLEAAGDADAAAALLIDAGDSLRLVPLIEQHGEEMLRHARFTTLRGWLAHVLEDAALRSPRLLMWRGLCEFAANDARWRASLAHAKLRLDESGDLVGSFTVRAWMLSTAASVEESRAIVLELQALVDRHWPSMRPEQQVEALAQLRTDMRTQEALTLLRDLHARTSGLLDASMDAEARLWFAAFLGTYAAGCGDLDCQRDLVSRVRPLLEAGSGSIRARANCLAVSSWHGYWCGSAADNRRMLGELAALGDVGGFHIDQNFVWQCALRWALAGRDSAAAARWERLARPIAKLVPYATWSF